MPSPQRNAQVDQADAIVSELKVHVDNLNTTLFRAFRAGVRLHVNAYYERSPRVVKGIPGVELMRVDINDIGLAYPPLKANENEQ